MRKQKHIPATLLSKYRERKLGRFSLDPGGLQEEIPVVLKIFLHSCCVVTFAEIFLADEVSFYKAKQMQWVALKNPSVGNFPFLFCLIPKA